MKTNYIAAIRAGTSLGVILLALATLLIGCQSVPPVREHVARAHPAERPVVLAYADYNSPTAGAPLFYDTTNMNWEEAPPFGRW